MGQRSTDRRPTGLPGSTLNVIRSTSPPAIVPLRSARAVDAFGTRKKNEEKRREEAKRLTLSSIFLSSFLFSYFFLFLFSFPEFPAPASYSFGGSGGFGSIFFMAFFFLASGESLSLRTIGLTWTSTHLKPSGSFSSRRASRAQGVLGWSSTTRLSRSRLLADGGDLVAGEDLLGRGRAARRWTWAR